MRRRFVSALPIAMSLLFVLAPNAPVTAQSDAPWDFETARVKQIGRDKAPPVPGANRDTTVEPHIAMDPNNPDHLVSVYQQSRFQDGGAVNPGFATSQDGGRTWVSGNIPGVTEAGGGPYDRASDPVAAFGPNGEAYATSLAITAGGTCPSGIAVNRSDDGGLTWNDPVWVQRDSCSAFNDKTWMAVDTFPTSPHFGRIYVTWDQSGGPGGFDVLLRWSDDQGETWGPLVTPYPPGAYPAGMVVQPNGDVTIQVTTVSTEVAVTSRDGGQTWGAAVTIGTFRGVDPPDIRAGNIWGLGFIAVDPTTGFLYTVWSDARFRSDGLNDIVISRSTNGGTTWTALDRVNQDATNSDIDHFTPAVAAHSGYVHVVYYRRDNSDGLNRFLQVGYTVSADDGVTFDPEMTLGRPVDLDYAAEVFFDDTKFLGDYIGLAASATTAHPVWCRSYRPPSPREDHQTTWSARIEK